MLKIAMAKGTATQIAEVVRNAISEFASRQQDWNMSCPVETLKGRGEKECFSKDFSYFDQNYMGFKPRPLGRAVSF